MLVQDPTPVKVICGILYSDTELLERAILACEREFGPIDYRSDAWPFDITDYYDGEMGSPIERIFISFLKLADPGELAGWKHITNRIETKLAVDGQRKVNLDIGYLDFDKLVLASAKYNGQKVYLGQGIYADPTLHYSKGQFEAYFSAFPDFKDDRYYGALLEIRERYKLGVRG
jgi:hypothetical protein